MQSETPRLSDVYEAARNHEEYNTALLRPYFHGAQSPGDGTVSIEVFPSGPAKSFTTEGVDWTTFSSRVHEWLMSQ